MRLYATCIAAALALASTGAAALELSADEAGELRERAARLLAARERNPEWDGGTRRVNEPQSAVNAGAQRGAAPVKTTQVKRKREPVKSKVRRAVRNIPGALVRER